MIWGVVTAVFHESALSFQKYFIAAVIMSVVVTYSSTLSVARYKIREDKPRKRQMLREFLLSVRTVFVFSIVGLSVIGLAAAIGIPISNVGRSVALPYALACVPVMIVVHDAYFYWTHRLMHLSPIYRWFHAEHHRSYNPSPWAAYSFAVPEAVVHGLFVPIYALLIPTPFWAIVSFVTFQIAMNVVGHSGIDLFPSALVTGRKSGIVTGTTHHDLHHAAYNYNFGLYFRLWDRLMATEHPSFVQIYNYVRSSENKGDGYGKLMRPSATRRDQRRSTTPSLPSMSAE